MHQLRRTPSHAPRAHEPDARQEDATLEPDGHVVEAGRGNGAAAAGLPATPDDPDLPFLAEMEAAFGEDFGGLDVAFGGSAPGGADARGAAEDEALWFADPTPDRELVAHELAHVVQGRRHRTGDSGTSNRADPAEVEARDVAARVASGGSAGALTAAPAAAVQLDEETDGGPVGRILAQTEDLDAPARLDVYRAKAAVAAQSDDLAALRVLLQVIDVEIDVRANPSADFVREDVELAILIVRITTAPGSGDADQAVKELVGGVQAGRFDTTDLDTVRERASRLSADHQAWLEAALTDAQAAMAEDAPKADDALDDFLAAEDDAARDDALARLEKHGQHSRQDDLRWARVAKLQLALSANPTAALALATLDALEAEAAAKNPHAQAALDLLGDRKALRADLADPVLGDLEATIVAETFQVGRAVGLRRHRRVMDEVDPFDPASTDEAIAVLQDEADNRNEAVVGDLGRLRVQALAHRLAAAKGDAVATVLAELGALADEGNPHAKLLMSSVLMEDAAADGLDDGPVDAFDRDTAYVVLQGTAGTGAADALGDGGDTVHLPAIPDAVRTHVKEQALDALGTRKDLGTGDYRRVAVALGEGHAMGEDGAGLVAKASDVLGKADPGQQRAVIAALAEALEAGIAGADALVPVVIRIADSPWFDEVFWRITSGARKGVAACRAVVGQVAAGAGSRSCGTHAELLLAELAGKDAAGTVRLMLDAHAATPDRRGLLATLGRILAVHTVDEALMAEATAALHAGIGADPRGARYSALGGLFAIAAQWTPADITALTATVTPDLVAAVRTWGDDAPAGAMAALFAAVVGKLAGPDRANAVRIVGLLPAHADAATVGAVRAAFAKGPTADAAAALVAILGAHGGAVFAAAAEALTEVAWPGLAPKLRDELVAYCRGDGSEALSGDAARFVYDNGLAVPMPVYALFQRWKLGVPDDRLRRAAADAVAHHGEDEVRGVFTSVETYDALPSGLRADVVGTDIAIDRALVVSQLAAGTLAGGRYAFLLQSVGAAVDRAHAAAVTALARQQKWESALREGRTVLIDLIAARTARGVGFWDRVEDVLLPFFRSDVDLFEAWQGAEVDTLAGLDAAIGTAAAETAAAARRVAFLELGQQRSAHSGLVAVGRLKDADAIALELLETWGGQLRQVDPSMWADATAESDDVYGQGALQRACGTTALPAVDAEGGDTFTAALGELGRRDGDTDTLQDLQRAEALRTLGQDPALVAVAGAVGVMGQHLPAIQALVQAALKGTKFDNLVQYLRTEAVTVADALKAADPHLAALKTRHAQLEAALGAGLHDDVRAQVQGQADAIAQMVEVMENAQLRELLAKARELTADTFLQWLLEGGAKLLGAIVGAVLLIVAIKTTILTGGAAMPLWVMALGGAVGALIGQELAAEAIHFARHTLDQDVIDGDQLYRDRSALGAWAADEEIFDQARGENVERTFAEHVLWPYTKQLVVSFTLSFATLGLGRLAGQRIVQLVQSPGGEKLLSRLGPRVEAFANRLRTVEQAGGDEAFRKGFLRQVGAEVVDELGDEAKEAAIEKVLALIDPRLGMLSSFLLATKRSVTLAPPTAPAVVRYTGDTGTLVDTLKADGHGVEATDDGAVRVTSLAGGRVLALPDAHSATTPVDGGGSMVARVLGATSLADLRDAADLAAAQGVDADLDHALWANADTVALLLADAVSQPGADGDAYRAAVTLARRAEAYDAFKRAEALAFARRLGVDPDQLSTTDTLKNDAGAEVEGTEADAARYTADELATLHAELRAEGCVITPADIPADGGTPTCKFRPIPEGRTFTFELTIGGVDQQRIVDEEVLHLRQFQAFYELYVTNGGYRTDPHYPAYMKGVGDNLADVPRAEWVERKFLRMRGALEVGAKMKLIQEHGDRYSAYDLAKLEAEKKQYITDLIDNDSRSPTINTDSYEGDFQARMRAALQELYGGDAGGLGNTGSAEHVPGSEHHGARKRHRDPRTYAFALQAAEAVPFATDRGGGWFDIAVDDATVGAVRVQTRDTGTAPDADIATYVLNTSRTPPQAVVSVSYRATKAGIERALLQTFTELRHKLRLHARGQADVADGLTDGDWAGTTVLSARDHGHVAVLQDLLGTLDGLAPDHPSRPAVLRELDALCSHLGLHTDWDGPRSGVRRALLDEALTEAECDQLDALLFDGPVVDLDQAERDAWAHRLFAQRVDDAHTPIGNDPAFQADPAAALADAQLAMNAQSSDRIQDLIDADAPVLDAPFVGGEAALTGVTPGQPVFTELRRWPTDPSEKLAQDTHQLFGVAEGGLADPSAFAEGDERPSMDAVRYWITRFAAQTEVHNARLQKFRLGDDGTFVADLMQRPQDAEHGVTLKQDIGITGIPTIATGFPRERSSVTEQQQAWQDAVNDGKAFLGDQANANWSFDQLREDFPPGTPFRVVVAGLGGTSVSAVENLLREFPDATITFVGDAWTLGLDDNGQWAEVYATYGPDGEDRITLREGVRLVGVSYDGDEVAFLGRDGTHDVEEFVADIAVSALGGRAMPQPVLDLLLDARGKGLAVRGEGLFDDGGHYVGYRLHIGDQHQVDVTGAASRFLPPDHIVPFPPKHRQRIDEAGEVDAPPESGNFAGGFGPSALQASRYRRFRAMERAAADDRAIRDAGFVTVADAVRDHEAWPPPYARRNPGAYCYDPNSKRFRRRDKVLAE